MAHPPPPILGWKEQVWLPEWDIRLRAKLDTGARSSALHVERIEEVGEHDVDGETLPVVDFTVLVGSRDNPEHRTVRAPSVAYRWVRDTGARSEHRHVVRTRLVCGPMDVETDITLTGRHGMNFRMLIGRMTMEGRCLVDPKHGYLHTPRPPRRRKQR